MADTKGGRDIKRGNPIDNLRHHSLTVKQCSCKAKTESANLSGGSNKFFYLAHMMKLVDVRISKVRVARRVGSTPTMGTTIFQGGLTENGIPQSLRG